MRRALAVAAVALAACTQQGTGVELFIEAGSLAPDRLRRVSKAHRVHTVIRVKRQSRPHQVQAVSFVIPPTV